MKHGIVIPCYNESSRLELNTFIEFAKNHHDITLCFVNDGSSDPTRSTLAGIKNLVHENVFVFNVEKNAGKANAVRQGALFLHRETDVDTIGFLDADLSTSFQDYGDLLTEIESSKGNLKIVFGSRNINDGVNEIERNPIRKLVSDMIRVLIFMITRLRIADTQCGAKVFHRELIPMIYDQSFFSRWLFDVEILLRVKKKMGKDSFLGIFLEKPLKTWVHMEGSKLSAKDSIMIPWNLIQIWLEYECKPMLKNAHLVVKR
ncbi:glycosyltransferase [Reichenbachiella agarivorans]|uniref:Glycosyltransferase n=1 Tax=Reichenbachiella agarivorans TaxID=2979464 RepID=A0ABY6CNJ7_9BACT|nr:glycosyltransferase [Reichenbachiella agarivorans]UXP32096.1 glycosyltransferase [Reichenbachiella agarivorans]